MADHQKDCSFVPAAEQATQEIVEDLEKEHLAEVEQLWEEERVLREELSRIVKLMREEIVPREQSFHVLVDGISEAFQEAMANMDGDMKEYLKSHKEQTADAFLRRESLMDPMKQMKDEIDRISGYLGHGEVQIQGGRSGGAAPGASPARGKPSGPSAGTGGRSPVASPVRGRVF